MEGLLKKSEIENWICDFIGGWHSYDRPIFVHEIVEKIMVVMDEHQKHASQDSAYVLPDVEALLQDLEKL